MLGQDTWLIFLLFYFVFVCNLFVCIICFIIYLLLFCFNCIIIGYLFLFVCLSAYLNK